MADMEREDGTTRDNLVQRVALMEAMIAEGRQTTARFGWLFVMLGLMYFGAVAWIVYLPFKNWAWPVCLAVGILVSRVVKSRRRRAGGGSRDQRSRSIEAVWRGMGSAIVLYVAAAVATHQASGPAYVAGILFFIGLAHAISAMILRWGVQGVAAAIWWAGGVATFFVTSLQSMIIFLVASFFGMICFGLYAMWLERQGAAAEGQHHA